MKNRSLTLSLIFIISSFIMTAQDTIYFTNKTLISCKISEVGITEIKYKRFENPEGPSYVNSKNEIERIKYVNGLIDTITYTGSKTADSISTESKNAELKNELRLIGTTLYYDNQLLGKLKTHHLIKNKSLSENQVKLIKDVNRLKQKEQAYNALGTGLFVTGFAIPTVVTLSALLGNHDYTSANNEAVTTIVAGAITGALFRIAGQVVVKVNKNKSRARRLAFLKKYSPNEVIY